jgi:hypothetical protein
MAYLAALFDKPDKSLDLHRIRDFTPEQFADFEKTFAEFIKLEQKFSLLRILELNFLALDSFVKKLQESNNNLDAYTVLAEMNRHFMNYLSSAYSLREHIKSSISPNFGRQSEHTSKYAKFLELLTKTHFEYAFFQDFRDFAQHCGFPVGEMKTIQNETGRRLTLKYSKAVLLENYKRWKYCDLQKRSEIEFDLIALVKRHHQIVTQEFSVVIQALYGKNLDNIESYFLGLQKEAKAIQESAIAKVVLSLPPNPLEGGTVTWRNIPLNPLVQLGLSRKVQTGSPTPKP